MQKFHNRLSMAFLIAAFAASNFFGTAFAAFVSPAQTAESIRASLLQAQLSLTHDPNVSAALVQEAEASYQTGLSASISVSHPDAHFRILSAFEDLTNSTSSGDITIFAAARAQVWTGILAGSYAIVDDAIQSGDGLGCDHASEAGGRVAV